MRWLAFILIGMVACGGAAKREASDPSEAQGIDDDTPKWEGAGPREEPTTKRKGAIVNERDDRRSDEYDKEATEVVLKRAARQVKDNCGSAKDENGKATGPWGKATIQIELGHNGRSKNVMVPPPYDGKPTGRCVDKAFSNLTFPPWAGTDTTVEWEVEIPEPANVGQKKTK
jgi:hypothetical protein